MIECVDARDVLGCLYKLNNISWCTKVEKPIHDNDLILTPVISPQSGWQWTWSCLELHMGGLGMEDDNELDIWEVSLDGTPNF